MNDKTKIQVEGKKHVLHIQNGQICPVKNQTPPPPKAK